MILYLTDAGRIQQRILSCRKFILIFGSINEYRLLKFSFRAWQKYCILSLLSLGWFSEGILINISPKKNAFVRVFTLTTLWLSAILKLDFLKSPGKSGSARFPRGMKLGNIFISEKKKITENSLWVPLLCEPSGPRESIPGNPNSQKSQIFKVWTQSPDAERGRNYGTELKHLVHQLRAENLGLWLTLGEQSKHVTY